MEYSEETNGKNIHRRSQSHEEHRPFDSRAETVFREYTWRDGTAGINSKFLQPYNPQQNEDLFQKSIVDPTLQTYNQQVVPGNQQHFVDANASSFSALNQALSQSATDLGMMLGSQHLDFFKQQQANQLAALSGLGGLAGQQTFQPLVNQRRGILGSLIGAGGLIGGAYGMRKL